jgi:hypothetical protein
MIDLMKFSRKQANCNILPAPDYPDRFHEVVRDMIEAWNENM